MTLMGKLDDDARMAELVAESNRREERVLQQKAVNDDDARWYLVNVVSGRERTAGDHLKRFKFEFYYPMTQVLKRVPRKELSAAQRRAGSPVRKPRLEALFKGYMFVRFNIANGAWQEVFRMRGIRGMFYDADNPSHVPDAVVTSIKASAINGYVPGSTKIEDVLGFKIGDKVVIEDGPFRFWTGEVSGLPTGFTPGSTVEELDESSRCEVLLSIFGRATPVHLKPGQFSKLHE